MDGVLVIDKPAGCTSHDVVARARRALGERRIGHTGTLDPFATGVLPLVVGRATRLAALLSGVEKEYEAGIRFGYVTDTYDITGVVSGDATGRRGDEIDLVAPPDLTSDAIEKELSRFRGGFQQMPPRYSAKKIGGVPAYRLARRNRDVQPAAVPVRVSQLELLEYRDGRARVRVRASAGFYVRALAHDLGAALGCGACLESLRRLRAGAFSLDDAVALDVVQLEGRAAAGRLIPLDRLLPDLPAVQLSERGAGRASHGNALGPDDLAGPVPVSDSSRPIRLLAPGNRLLGLAEAGAGGLLHPVVVLV